MIQQRRVPSLGRHERNCRICSHPREQALEVRRRDGDVPVGRHEQMATAPQKIHPMLGKKPGKRKKEKVRQGTTGYVNSSATTPRRPNGKGPYSNLPLVERLKILQLNKLGKSLREIEAETGRATKTVARIVNGPEGGQIDDVLAKALLGEIHDILAPELVKRALAEIKDKHSKQGSEMVMYLWEKLGALTPKEIKQTLGAGSNAKPGTDRQRALLEAFMMLGIQGLDAYGIKQPTPAELPAYIKKENDLGDAIDIERQKEVDEAKEAADEASVRLKLAKAHREDHE